MTMTLETARLRTRRFVDDLNVGTDADAALGLVRWSTEEVDAALEYAVNSAIDEGVAGGLMMFRQSLETSSGATARVTFVTPPRKIINVFMKVGNSTQIVYPGTMANRNFINTLSAQALIVDHIASTVFPTNPTDPIIYAALPSLNEPVLDNYVCAIAASYLMTKTGEINNALAKTVEMLRTQYMSRANSPSISVQPIGQVFNMPFYWGRYCWGMLDPVTIQIFI